ncbi:MAG: EF-P beta-lysylation protein EpmB [Chlamydiota bacterium]
MTIAVLPPTWRQIQKNNFKKWTELVSFLELNQEQSSKILKKCRFPLNLPYRLAAKIEKKTLDDPILKQFLPVTDETMEDENFSRDPVGDRKALCSPKLLHKYHGRVLLVTTSSCAMHCRYCFRRHFDYEVERKDFEPEIESIRHDPTVKEVILSGGDPLSLSNVALRTLISQIDEIPHVTKLRFHTRFPIGIPERIDEEFLEIIENSRLKVWFVIHSNHPRELDKDLFAYLNRLQRNGVTVLNQAVLLAGINDNVDTLTELCEKLVDHGVVPYYLHQLDRVAGATHFEVPIEKGKRMIEELKRVLPGYAVPRYVKEVPGEAYKVEI